MLTLCKQDSKIKNSNDITNDNESLSTISLHYTQIQKVTFQRVPGYPFKMNTGTRAAVCHISDTPSHEYHTDAIRLVLHGNSPVSYSATTRGSCPFSQR